ncbi:MAG TPA: hypothetical protein VIF62_39305, partial [Labilithrix sp.]
MRKKRIALGVVAVVVVAACAWARLAMWPWLAAPEQGEVDREWALVGRAVDEGPKLRGGDDARFDAFAASLYGAKRDLETLARTENARTDETLPEKVHASVSALAAWAETASAADDRAMRCGVHDKGPLYVVPTLAEMVLRAEPDEPRVRTFVALSERLRRGGTYVQWILGMHVLARVLDWAEASHAAPRFLVDTGADTRELRAAIARDAKCLDGFFDGATRASFAAPSTMEGDYVPWFARTIVRPERERAMVRREAGTRLERCEAALADAPRYLDCLAADVASDMDGLPKSVAVRMTLMPLRFHDEAKTFARLRALVK